MEIKEIWKDCKGYEGLYQVSNQGRVWSVKGQRYFTGSVNNRGYYATTLTAKNGKRKTEMIHRLVALAFLDNPNNYPQVNHKDENKLNNCVDNLEWCDAKYNINYGTRNDRMAKTQSRKVRCVETGIIYDSIKEAEEQLGLSHGKITMVCQGKRKTTGGYHWEYYNG